MFCPKKKELAYLTKCIHMQPGQYSPYLCGTFRADSVLASKMCQRQPLRGPCSTRARQQNVPKATASRPVLNPCSPAKCAKGNRFEARAQPVLASKKCQKQPLRGPCSTRARQQKVPKATASRPVLKPCSPAKTAKGAKACSAQARIITTNSAKNTYEKENKTQTLVWPQSNPNIHDEYLPKRFALRCTNTDTAFWAHSGV